MSDGEEAQRVADKWGEFQDEVDHTPRVLQKVSYKEASILSCLECRGTTFQTPGSKGWGTSCTNCHMSISLSAPEPAEDEKKTKKFSKPFCCFCRTKIGYDAPYYRMVHPNGGVNSWNNMPRVVYRHADGEKCEGEPLPESDYKCSTCAYKGPNLRDMLGAGKKENVFCQDCKYKTRAALLVKVQKTPAAGHTVCSVFFRKTSASRLPPSFA